MLHKNASLGSRHAIHNWAPADAAALAAIVPVAGDNGKVALQLDTGDLWALVDYTGPTWIALTIQAADAPVQSINGATGIVVLDAGDIAFTPASGIAATDVQAAIVEAKTDLDATKIDKLLALNAEVASYTLVLADADLIVEMDVATGNNLTVPTNASVAFPVGTMIHILQVNAGQTVVVPDTGVTINSSSTLKLRTQWSVATLLKRATDTWLLFGDLEAAP